MSVVNYLKKASSLSDRKDNVKYEIELYVRRMNKPSENIYLVIKGVEVLKVIKNSWSEIDYTFIREVVIVES